jgi:hypothetical protein
MTAAIEAQARAFFDYLERALPAAPAALAAALARAHATATAASAKFAESAAPALAAAAAPVLAAADAAAARAAEGAVAAAALGARWAAFTAGNATRAIPKFAEALQADDAALLSPSRKFITTHAHAIALAFAALVALTGALGACSRAPAPRRAREHAD